MFDFLGILDSPLCNAPHLGL